MSVRNSNDGLHTHFKSSTPKPPSQATKTSQPILPRFMTRKPLDPNTLPQTLYIRLPPEYAAQVRYLSNRYGKLPEETALQLLMDQLDTLSGASFGGSLSIPAKPKG